MGWGTIPKDMLSSCFLLSSLLHGKTSFRGGFYTSSPCISSLFPPPPYFTCVSSTDLEKRNEANQSGPMRTTTRHSEAPVSSSVRLRELVAHRFTLFSHCKNRNRTVLKTQLQPAYHPWHKTSPGISKSDGICACGPASAEERRAKGNFSEPSRLQVLYILTSPPARHSEEVYVLGMCSVVLHGVTHAEG